MSEDKKVFTIRQIYDLVSPTHNVFIKPNGRKVYFEGVFEDIPEFLLDVPVTEMSSKVYANDSYEIKVCNFYSCFGFWVEGSFELEQQVEKLQAKNSEKYNIDFDSLIYGVL